MASLLAAGDNNRFNLSRAPFVIWIEAHSVSEKVVGRPHHLMTVAEFCEVTPTTPGGRTSRNAAASRADAVPRPSGHIRLRRRP
jgi:hypothetical protein